MKFPPCGYDPAKIALYREIELNVVFERKPKNFVEYKAT